MGFGGRVLRRWHRQVKQTFPQQPPRLQTAAVQSGLAAVVLNRRQANANDTDSSRLSRLPPPSLAQPFWLKQFWLKVSARSYG